jgi:hypothetical protein
LVFPDGILYNHKNNGCRTQKVNSIFLVMAQLARVSGHKKTGS